MMQTAQAPISGPTNGRINGQVGNLPPREAPSSQRDERGRFVRGNTVGAGNPFARKVAWLRTELVDCLTREDVRNIAGSLIANASCGDVASTKILFSYVFGKPGACPDPDRLDLQEIQLMKEEGEAAGQAPEIMGNSGLAFPLKTMRIMRPMMSQMHLGTLSEVLAMESDAAEEKLEELMYGSGEEAADEAGDEGEQTAVEKNEIGGQAATDAAGRVTPTIAKLQESIADSDKQMTTIEKSESHSVPGRGTEGKLPSLRTKGKKKKGKRGRSKSPSTAGVSAGNGYKRNGHMKKSLSTTAGSGMKRKMPC